MNTEAHNDTDLYQAPATDVVGQFGEFDESSMFSPKGRAGRLRYFIYGAGFAFLLSFTMGLLSGIIAAIGKASGFTTGAIEILPIAAYFVLMTVTIIFMIKRLHDLNWSGWISLLSVVPFINIVLGLILLFAPGNSGPNKYGPPPKPENNAVAIIFATLLLVAFVGIIAAVAIPAYNDYDNRARQVQQHP